MREHRMKNVMRRKLIVSHYFIVVLLGLGTGCNKPKTTTAQPPRAQVTPTVPTSTPIPPPRREWGPAYFDVCALLTNQEVAELQQQEEIGTRSVGGIDGALRISQCFYLSRDGKPQVTLSVATPQENNSAHQVLKDYWDASLSPRENRRNEGDADSERAEQEEALKRKPPEPIEGIGEEAIWWHGTLAVLQNESMLRVSISGLDDEKVRLEKAKTVATKALPRLSEVARGTSGK